MARLVITAPALDDINAIASYIERDSKYYASVFVETIFERTANLKEHPRLGRIVPEAEKTI